MLDHKLLATILAAAILFCPSTFAASPLSWKGYAVAEDVANFHGGSKDGSTGTAAGRLTALYDTAKASWWPGGQIALGVLGIARANNQANYTAAIQTPSSDYSPVNEIRLTDLAYQQTFNANFMARVGIMDYDDYFNDLDVANNMLNSAFNNTMALSYNVQLATYPYPGFGALAQIGDSQKLSLLIGVFQGNPQHQHTVLQRGQLVIAELADHFAVGTQQDVQLTVKGGLWNNQQNRNYLGVTETGVYLIGEVAWTIKSGRNLALGLNIGINPKKTGFINDSLAVAFSIGSLWQSRPKDSLNLGIGHVWLTGAQQQETFFEIGYAIALTDTINLTPDLQYFLHPGTVYPNAWVGLLRLQYTIPTT